MSTSGEHLYETAEPRHNHQMPRFGENVYRTEIGDSETTAVPPRFKVPTSPTKKVKTGTRKFSKQKIPQCRIIIAGIVALTIIVALIVAVLVQFNVSQPKQSGFSGDEQVVVTNTSTSTSDARSCLDIRNRNITDDGIYEVTPDDNFGPSQTFCDMTTDGGGWTLVASIHESNITKKCYPDDLWSSYQHVYENEFPAKSNWENKMIFGNVQHSTTADFKHSGFFAMNASDVMVWHVRNDVTSSMWKKQSTLRYRTNNKFLQSNGGNIGALYKDKFALTVTSEYVFSSVVLDALASKGGEITKIFPNFYNYAYSSYSLYSHTIPDANMYRPTYYGNRIYFYASTPRCNFALAYGNDYKCPGVPTSFGTRKSKPFFAVATILNNDKKTAYYYMQSYSDRPYVDENDETNFPSATMTKENLKLQYEMVQYKNSSYVTIGELYFVVSNEKDWGSVEPTKFYRSYDYHNQYHRRNRYRVEGSPVNIILGYTLVTISYGGAISKEQENKVAEEILNAIEPLKTLFVGTGLSGPSPPVVFDKGSSEEVMTMIPPAMQPFVQPGFLQFRAYNASGYPSAFCPGIKVSSIHPEYTCVGSISDRLEDHGTCGDFAGWEGISTDVVQTNDASGFAHSHKDIYSTILIFQR